MKAKDFGAENTGAQKKQSVSKKEEMKYCEGKEITWRRGWLLDDTGADIESVRLDFPNVAVTGTMTKAPWGRQRFSLFCGLQVTVRHWRKSGQRLKQELEAETMEDKSLLKQCWGPASLM